MRRALMLVAVLVGVAGCVPANGVVTRTVAGARSSAPALAPGSAALGPPAGPVIDRAVDPACGTELWAKKTLTDPDAGLVNPQPTAVSSVAQLNQVPDAGAQNPDRRVGVELGTWQFTGELVKAKLEADSDYHVVMRDQSGATLVTEYPAAECVQDAAPAAAEQIDAARQAFEQACGPVDATSFKALSGTATVTGVGFYDRDHGQTGRDSLGDGSDVELHPVIGFKGSCGGGGLGRARRGSD